MSHVTHVTVSRCHSVTLSLCHGGLTASLLIVCNVLGKPNICLLLEKFSGLEIRSSQYVHRSYSSVRELLSQSPLCSAANQCTNTKTQPLLLCFATPHFRNQFRKWSHRFCAHRSLGFRIRVSSYFPILDSRCVMLCMIATLRYCRLRCRVDCCLELRSQENSTVRKKKTITNFMTG